jgi:hypothetical protein
MALPDIAAMTKQDGLRLRQARQARVRRIRARVIGGSVALFIAVWMLITVVLVTGHDPALARTAVTRSATRAVTTSSSTSATSSGATSTSTGSGASGVSSVTSSQS